LCQLRLKALEKFLSLSIPEILKAHGVDDLNFDKIRYYLANDQGPQRTWDELPSEIKETFDRLGIPEREGKFLPLVEPQFDSEAAYNLIQDAMAKEGVFGRFNSRPSTIS
jgi:Fe-S cluster assembly protein SufB